MLRSVLRYSLYVSLYLLSCMLYSR